LTLDGLKLYDTLSRTKKPFKPLSPGRVKMFVCGPTVQSPMHLGHARTYLFYDALASYLRHLGNDVTYLMNITDIDESISAAALKAGKDPLDYSERMSASFISDFRSLKISSVTRYEPVSNHIEDMIGQVASLLDKGFAYEADGWVYFDTSKFPRWGRLSHQSRKDLSMRPLELSPRKRGLNDFALWRPEVLVSGRWKSPWGTGSPGWHIQDTAVTIPILGSQYDVHGGAIELIYPHHEAEIAQAESLTGARPFVKHWVHTNLLNMEGQKMSKSLGNVVTVSEALRSFTPDELRFSFLSIHYRAEADLTGVGAASARLATMRALAKDFAEPGGVDGDALAGFQAALNDDFDTPMALRWAEYALKRAGRTGDRARAKGLADSAIAAMRILGVNLLGNS
jgi:cysteinyl-tRNA synthetase